MGPGDVLIWLCLSLPKSILNGDAIDVYNHGDMSRDFTYIDDLVHGMRSLIDAIPGFCDLCHGYI